MVDDSTKTRERLPEENQSEHRRVTEAKTNQSQRTAEQALRESEERYRMLSEAAEEGVAIHDQGIIIDANEALARMFGYRLGTIIGISAKELATAETWEAILQIIGSGADSQYDGIGVRKDGSTFNCQMTGKPFRYRGKNLRIATFRDITSLKQIEEELRHLRNLLSNIINSMPSVLVGVDTKGRVTQWNTEAERVTGISSTTAQGKQLAEVFPKLESEMEKVWRAVRYREIQRQEKLPSKRNGQTHFEDLTVYPLVANGVEGAVIRIDDVTERIRIEEMMIQSEKMSSVGGLAAGMAHEINNPLAGILQNTQLVKQRLAADFDKNQQAAEECGISMEDIRHYLDQRQIPRMMNSIISSGKRASRIVENMLSFSRRAESGTSTHDLAALLDSTLDLCSSDYDLKKKYDFRKIAIVRRYDPEMPEVTCSSSKIQQVFLNLLKNGAEAMAEAQTENPHFVLSMTRDEEMARIEIEDNGPGIPDELSRRIFEPFFTTKDIGAGTGLGLSVSYFIVTENHGGTLTVDSTLGKGTKFTVSLPLGKRN